MAPKVRNDQLALLGVFLEFPIVHVLRDRAIELVLVNRIETPLKLFVALLELRHRRVVHLALGLVVLLHGLLQPFRIWRDVPGELFKERHDLRFHGLLPHERPMLALPVVVAISVPVTLRDRPRIHAGAVLAPDESLEELVMLLLPRSAIALPLQHFLYSVKRGARDERRMFPWGLLPVPRKRAVVVRVRKEYVHLRFAHPLPLPRAQPLRVHLLDKCTDGILSGRVVFEHLSDEGRVLLVHDLNQPPVRLLVLVSILPTKKREPALLELHDVRLLHLLPEVPDVILREHDLDVPLKLFVRSRILVNHEAFFHEVNPALFITIKPVVDHDRFFEVARHAVHLLHENLLDPVLPHILHHLRERLTELLPARGLRHEILLHHLKPLALRVFERNLLLGRKRVPLLCLPLRGHPGVDDGFHSMTKHHYANLLAC